MLDPWIIEEIRRREEEERQHRDERPVLELPLEAPRHEQGSQPPPNTDERGVVIVDFRV